MKIFLDDLALANKLLKERHGMEIAFCFGLAGEDFNLEDAVLLRDILNEILEARD